MKSINSISLFLLVILLVSCAPDRATTDEAQLSTEVPGSPTSTMPTSLPSLTPTHSPLPTFTTEPASNYTVITIIGESTPALRYPTGIGFNSSATIAWVTEEVEGEGTLLRVDLQSGAVSPVVTGLNQPGHLFIEGEWAFVAGNIGDPIALVRIDLDDGEMTAVSDGLSGGLSGVTVNDSSRQAYVVNSNSGELSQVDIDPTSSTFKQVSVITEGLSGPRDVVVDETSQIAYVSEQEAGTLIRVNVDPESINYGLSRVLVDGLDRPRGLALNASHDKLYMTLEGAGKLSVVNLATGEISDLVAGLDSPRDVAIDSARQIAWVTIHNALIAIDINLDSPNYCKQIQQIGDVSLLFGARGLELSPDEKTAYVVSEWSGIVSRVDIDPSSPGFGRVDSIANDLYILTDIDVNQDGTFAYVTRERRVWGPAGGNLPQGDNALVRVDLRTGEVVTLSDRLGQPTSIVLSRDEKEGFVVDISEGRLLRVDLASGDAVPIASGIENAYGIAINRDETLAYLVTASEDPKGDILQIDLITGEVLVLAKEAVYASQSIVLSKDEKLAYVTEFGAENSCNGALSEVIIDPSSPDYGTISHLVIGLCGPHDVRFDKTETTAYIAEVEGKRLLRIQFPSDD